MNKSIIVGSMNIQNKYKIANYNGLDENGNDNAKRIEDFLEKYQVDILGTQELVRLFINRLKQILNPKYQVYGDFRFGNSKIFQKLSLIDRFNESASIITKHQVIKCRTLTLPWFPKKVKDIVNGIKTKTIRPRVLTKALIDIEDFGRINFMNTHIEYRQKNIQIRQIDYIKKQIEKSKNPVILTGDFNMCMDSDILKKFVDDLNNIGYKRVPNAKMTYKYRRDKLPIDHIFISKDWNIEEVEIPTDSCIDEISDHYPILVRISK